MSQYNSLNVKLSNLQLNKLKSEIKAGTEVTLNLSRNVIGDSNNESNFQQTLFLSDRQVLRPRETFANNIRLLKTQLSKIVQSGGFLSRLLGYLLKADLALMKNILKPLAKSVLLPLG